MYKKFFLFTIFLCLMPISGVTHAQIYGFGGRVVGWFPCVTGFAIFVFPPSLAGVGPYYVPFATTKGTFRPPLQNDKIIGKFLFAPVPACWIPAAPSPIPFPIPQFPVLESYVSF